MNLNAVGVIYEFRPQFRGGETKIAAQTPRQSEKPRQLDLFELSSAQAEARENPPAPDWQNDQGDGVAAVLDRFVAEKVRRHDQDRDGRLSKAEFHGNEQEFAQLDEDGDGFIGAPDLKRQLLADNPQLRNMAEGFAGGLYNQIMNSPAAQPEELAKTVQSFFEGLVAQHDQDRDGVLRTEEFPGTQDEFQQVRPKAKDTVSADNLIAGFTQQNPDLVELRESLLQLKETVKPAEVRQMHLDLYT